MERIGVEERRARLVRRHRLAPADRAASRARGDAEPRRAPLHRRRRRCSCRCTRGRELTQEDIERELYDERSLVRMLGMRRTLFVVPRELVPVVEAAATRAIAARERKRLEQMIAVSELSKQPAAWLRRAMATALREVEARGEAFTSDLTKSVPVLAKRLRFGTAGTKWETTLSAGSRILPQLAMERKIVRGRPRTTWANGQYRWVPTAAWLGAEIEPARSGARAGSARRALARGLRARNRDRPALVDGLDGPGDARGARRGPACRGRPRRSDRLRARGRPRADRARRSRQPRCSRRSTRRRWAGRSAILPRPARAHPLRHDRQCRADRLVGGPRRRRLVAAPRRRDRVPAARGRRRGRRRRDRGGGRAHARRGSATRASRRASSRPSSGSSAPRRARLASP